ncbi:peptidoglycan-binding protein [Streptococcus rubneri]|uniref:LysM peptidoglycan-binding domain-containing protein n=1 Tax=Streptococcus rubneri TaxID=1234680 RepID=A0A4Z1DXX9_9STRE|nr:LysM peptidoglycan-binding domain-containing protein [Streptococcus rubneri]MBK4773462.1 peptidoglycan-binding protein [Streptococcus rubneri]TGN92825.1 LysM peptidoglycan-binding domain-containing protein [Streptococcus rubneri]
MNTKKVQWTLTSVVSALSLFVTSFVVNAETYEVKTGDTLSQIAIENNTTVQKLVELNQLSNKDLIHAGQIIELGERSNSLLNTVKPATASQAQATQVTQATTAQVQAGNTTYNAAPAVTSSNGIVLANGNTAGETGAYAAARMAELTGVPASTWEAIIARESNGQVNAANASGASGLFQTMPGWGSTATVDDQIQSAYNAYSNQGLSAWGY